MEQKIRGENNIFQEKLTLKQRHVNKISGCSLHIRNDDLNEKVINILSKNGVRAIAIRAAGYNNVDIRAAYHNRVRVFRVPAYSPYSVAEHSLALLMGVNRKNS